MKFESIGDALSVLYWLEEVSKDDSPLTHAIKTVMDSLEEWEELLLDAEEGHADE